MHNTIYSDCFVCLTNIQKILSLLSQKTEGQANYNYTASL